jgi:hypothetical protein
VQVVQTGVDAVAIAIQRPPLVRRQLGVGLPHHRAQAVAPMVEVGLERARADQLGQFAGRQPAHQVHLEEALLGVHEAQCPGEVVAAVGGQGDAAERVAFHRYRRGQRRGGEVAAQSRTAVGQRIPGGEEGDEHHGHQAQGQPAEDPAQERSLAHEAKTAKMPA